MELAHFNNTIQNNNYYNNTNNNNMHICANIFMYILYTKKSKEIINKYLHFISLNNFNINICRAQI